MLHALDLRVTHDDRTVFDGLNLSLRAGERAGLVGPNGAGKSSLLRVLAGEAAPAAGAVGREPGAVVAHLPQEPPGDGVTLGDRLAGAQPWEAERARRALGILHLPPGTPLASLSGGEAARALLAGVLLAEPTVLLLDEPTNHLDVEGLAWLERWLARFPGAVLAVSHDRRFLDAIAHRVLELEDGRLTSYAGGYTRYREAKARAREKLLRDLEAQDKRRRRLEADIASTRGFAQRSERMASGLGADKQKRYAKKVAAKAQARERRLQREMASERWIERPRDQRALRVAIDGAARGALVAALRGVTAGFGGAPVLRGADLAVHGRDRIALTGPNGSGKTTVLALLAGTLAPARGHVERPREAAYLPQGGGVLPADRSATAWVRAGGAGEAQARRLLGHFGLEGAAALRPLGTLSPGERARVAVAAMVARGAPLLLLDEPTNHLDLPALEALEAALRDYPGAIVAVSHDRAFLDGIGVERRLRVRDGRLREQ